MVQVNNKGRTFTELSWLEIAHVFAELIGAQVVINYKSGYSCYVDYHYTRQDGIQCCTGVAKIKKHGRRICRMAYAADFQIWAGLEFSWHQTAGIAV